MALTGGIVRLGTGNGLGLGETRLDSTSGFGVNETNARAFSWFEDLA